MSEKITDISSRALKEVVSNAGKELKAALELFQNRQFDRAQERISQIKNLLEQVLAVKNVFEKLETTENALKKLNVKCDYGERIVRQYGQGVVSNKKSSEFSGFVQEMVETSRIDLDDALRIREEKRLAREAKEKAERERVESLKRLAMEAREKEVKEKFEAIPTYALSVEKKVTKTENKTLIRHFKNLQNILSSGGMKKLFSEQAFDFLYENLSRINGNLNNLEKMADAYLDDQKHLFIHKSAMPPLFETGPKSLLTLIEGCMAPPNSLQKYHKSEITALNAYKIWSDNDNYEFLSDEMKDLHRKTEHLDLKINSLTCAEYYKLFQLITRFEDQAHTSIDAVKALEFDKVSVIHKDWLEFIACRRGLKSNIRVYELAKMLNMTNKTFLTKLRAYEHRCQKPYEFSFIRYSSSART